MITQSFNPQYPLSPNVQVRFAQIKEEQTPEFSPAPDQNADLMRGWVA